MNERSGFKLFNNQDTDIIPRVQSEKMIKKPGNVYIDKTGEWTKAKHSLIKNYVAIRTKIIGNSKTPIKCHYIDAFSGAGEHIVRNTGKHEKGSPLIVLDVPKSFNKYYFIDNNKEKIDYLKNKCKKEYPNEYHNIECLHGNYLGILNNLLTKFSYKNYDRVFCLLDPYGLDLDWRIIKKLGELGVSEGKGIVDLVINFSVMEMNRCIGTRNPSNAKKASIAKMNRAWGDESWKNIAYEDDLFNNSNKGDYKEILKGFTRRLKDEAGFSYVPDPMLTGNDTNAPMFCFFFASHEKRADEVMNYLIEKEEKAINERKETAKQEKANKKQLNKSADESTPLFGS